MDWAQILVIILTVFLIIFLVLAIVLAVLLIRITKQIKAVASTAGYTVTAINKAATGLSKATTMTSVAQMILSQISKNKSDKSNESKGNQSERS